MNVLRSGGNGVQPRQRHRHRLQRRGQSFPSKGSSFSSFLTPKQKSLWVNLKNPERETPCAVSVKDPSSDGGVKGKPAKHGRVTGVRPVPHCECPATSVSATGALHRPSSGECYANAPTFPRSLVSLSSLPTTPPPSRALTHGQTQVSHMTVSSTMLVLNKAVLKHIPAPTTVLLFQVRGHPHA